MIETLIQERRANIGIIGLGYVGLPLAIEFAERGFNVRGFEVDPAKVKAINEGRSYISDVDGKRIGALVKDRKISASLNFDLLAKMDAIIICVPTPLRKSKDPDISYILAAVQKVRKTLQRGQLIVLESTTYPGTTREVLLPILNESGFTVGKDYYLAFSPERVDPGNKKYGIHNTPKVVGGMTPECSKLAKMLYGTIVEKIVGMSSTEAAEMVKLLENTFRAVNIGLVNEIALMCHRLKLDTWEVIDAAATKPFGYMPFYPGPGLGGHCIPLDPHYLSWKLKSLNFYARFIELAGEINSQMPEVLVRRVSDALNEAGQSLNGARILVLGVAYKRDIGDVRESPALDVIELLKKRKAIVTYHDPYVEAVRVNGYHLKNTALSPDFISKQDCVVITTHHSCFDFPDIVRHSKLVVDSRNATAGIESKKVVKL